MKVNLRKVGAIVAGATILASSAAFAGLMFGSTTLVDDNGAPVAKVVVGSAAQPSDGVAAALIAGKIISETYKSSTLTAQVSGTAACAAGSTTATTGGTCSISNKKTTLEITVPGTVAAGTWTGNNLIGDYLDRTLQDREAHGNAATDTTSGYPAGNADTSDTANPFTDGATGNIGSDEAFMYKISGDTLSTFADQTLTDPDSGKSYVEHQAVWVDGDNRYNKDSNAVVGDLNFFAYSLKFDGPGGKTLGIPECSVSVDSDYTACKYATVPSGTSVDDATETHKMKISFLGEDWIISEMDAPAGILPGENQLKNGGEVKLAKESVSGIVNQGESLPVDNLKFQLDDLEAHGDIASAIISILDANGNVLKKDTILPGTTKDYTINGKDYKFHVYKVAPGYTFGAKWADVAIFSEELDLQDGQKLDQGKGTNDGYKVALGWKNLDAATGDAHQTNPDTLRTIVLYADDPSQISSSGDTILAPGDYVSLVQDPAVWKLSYKGLDLTADNKAKLKFDLKTSSKTISASDGPFGLSAIRVGCTINAPYMQVTDSATGSVFTVDRNDNTAGQISDNQFYVALNSTNAAVCNTTTVLPQGTVFMKESTSGSEYGYAKYAAPLPVQYQLIGDGDTTFAKGGVILVEVAANSSATDNAVGTLLNSAGINPVAAGWSTISPTVFFAVAEKAGVGTSSDFTDYYLVPVAKTGTGNPSDATLSFNSDDGSGQTLSSDNDKTLYVHARSRLAGGTGFEGPVDLGVNLVDTGYISERGSSFDSQSSGSVGLTMAHKLANAQWFLAPASSNVTSSSTSVATLGEGDSTTVNGVTVKVDTITQDVGACSATGGASGCTADMSGVSAVIMPNNAATVNVAMPYAYSNYGNLVILDQDAVGVSTLISVGGDQVNTVTAGLLQGSAVDWSTTPQVVKEVVQGSKIVVAGATKDDTLAAAQSFVSQLKKV